MRLAVRALLACAVLGKCGERKPAESGASCPPDPAYLPLGSALGLEAGEPWYPRTGLALSQRQLCASVNLLALPVPLPLFHALLASASSLSSKSCNGI